MSKIVYLVALFAPTLVFAQAFPDFPMAFWGRVTINSDPAPTGSVVRAYYSDNSLAGEVTVSEPGIYGYSSPLKNKLVVGEGGGEINFRILAPGYNSGNETGGTSALTYSGFVSGETINKDLAFSIVQPTPTPTQTGGGGGGGGGGGVLPPQITPTPSPSATPTPTPTSSPQQQPVGEVLGITTYRFERDLRVGMRVDDVTELQTRLQQEGVYSGPITGYFGSLTRAAVNTYQKQNGLPQTGYLEAATRQQLNGEYGGSVAGGALIRAKGDIDVYIVKYVREKKLDLTVFQDAKGQGRTAIRLSSEIVQGKQVEKEFLRVVAGMYHSRIEYPEDAGGITADWDAAARA